MSLEEFAPHVGANFALSVDEAGRPATSLVLTEAAPSLPATGDGRPFHLLFEGSPDARLEQGTYWLRRDGESSMAIFLVPIGPDRYEAVFN